MNSLQFTPFAILYIIAAIVAFSLSIFVGKIRSVRGKTYFRLLALFSGIWTLGYTLQFFSTDVNFKLIMLRVEYLGIICSIIFWLLFVLSYTNSDNWLNKGMKTLICLIPAITYIQVLTFQYHNFFYLSFEYVEKSGLLVAEKVYGPGFYFWMIYSYLILIIGGVILIRSILNMPVRFRRHILVFVIILSVIIVPNLFYILDKNPFSPYDPTCLSFVIVGLLFFIIIRFDKFLNIVPVAYNLVLRSTKSGVIIINDAGDILDINPSAEKIFNIRQEDVVGSNIFNYLSQYDEIYNKLKVNQEFSVEFNLGKSGDYYELIVTLLEDYKKRVLGRILVFYNITKRKQAIFELDAYARTVAHDIKNPINAVSGFVQLLQNTEPLTDEQEQFCQLIYDGVMNIKDITEGLLLLARVRNEKEIETTQINTADIIESVLYKLDDNIKKSNAEINIAKEWPSALGYPIWVEEVWINYISNALKYGGDPPVIEIGASSNDDIIKFWVKDNGKGLTKKEQESLFKEFSQLENRKTNTQGHGLGLSIVERIIHRLDGDVWVDSKPGKGSVFYFTLPKYET